jgi:predicted PurR-regulated permease PerM
MALRGLLFAAAIALSIALLPFLSGLFGAVILFVAARRPYALLTRRAPPRTAAGIIVLGTLMVLLIPAAWLAATIVSQTTDFVSGVDPSVITRRIAESRFGSPEAVRVIGKLSDAALAWLSGQALDFVGGATSAVLNTFIALTGLYYLLVDGPRLWRRARAVLPMSDVMLDALSDRFVHTTDALLLGTLFTAVLQGSLVGAAFAVAGLAPAALWGFVTACASVLPLFGSALVWLPGSIVLFAAGRPGAAIGLAAFGAVVVSNIDNLVRPIVYRRVSGIHPMLTIVGAFAGVRLFGLIGALVGPLLLSYVVELTSLYERAAKTDGLTAP